MNQNDIAEKDVAVFVGVVERMLDRVKAESESERSKVYEGCIASTRRTVEQMSGPRGHSLIDAMRTAILTVEQRYLPESDVGGVAQAVVNAAAEVPGDVSLSDDFADEDEATASDDLAIVDPVLEVDPVMPHGIKDAAGKGSVLSGLLRRFSRSREKVAA